jgi:hypothetical protein
VCVNGVPQVRYAATPEGTTASTVTLHWSDRSGGTAVQADLPLSGTTPWPAGVAVGTADIRFVVNPEVTVTVTPTSGCVTTTSHVLAASSSSGSSAVLAATGSETLPVVALGSGLLLAGAGVLVARSLRQRKSS